MSEWKFTRKNNNTLQYDRERRGVTFLTAYFLLTPKEVRVRSASFVIRDGNGIKIECEYDNYTDLTVEDLKWLTSKAKELFKECD